MKITNSDLRIGNLVVYKGEVCIVSGILRDERLLLNDIEVSISTCEIAGYEIDRRSLELLEFEEYLHKPKLEKEPDYALETIVTLKPDKYGDEITMSLKIYFDFKNDNKPFSYLLFKKDSINFTTFKLSINYIHELQNLCYIFNQSELEINKLINHII
jgi:hypothetical protein